MAHDTAQDVTREPASRPPVRAGISKEAWAIVDAQANLIASLEAEVAQLRARLSRRI